MRKRKASASPSTVREVLHAGSAVLTNSTVTDTPYLDALLLLEYALQTTRERLLASMPDTLAMEQIDLFQDMLEARSQGTPIAYILGEKEFYGRTFTVDSRVLIPRPDTEILVETAMKYYGAGPENARIADVCCGSGCVGITLKAELPGIDMVLADISSDALAVAKENSQTILGRGLPLIQSDLLNAVPGEFDMIVSNPPYVTDAECADPAVRRNGEPLLALAAGEDGLDIIRILAIQGFSKLHEKGYLIIEHGFQQAEGVRCIFLEAGFSTVKVLQDLAGRDRVTVGMKTDSVWMT